MFGLIGKMRAVPGARDELLGLMLADPDGLWITEVWESPAHHQTCLTLPSVRPLIDGFEQPTLTEPVGG